MKAHFPLRPVFAASLALTLGLLTGCSSLGTLFGSDSIDYRSQAGKTAALDVPPDLTQLARDGRYQPQAGGVVSASNLKAPGVAAPATAPSVTGTAVAPSAVGDVRVVKEGNQRWLVSPEPPEKLYPIVREFWAERGFVLAIDSPEVGVMETDWAENRAKLPQDMVRRTLGRVLESFYATGERDRFRTRIERSASGGSEVFIVHRGLEEVYDNERKERTMWQARARDTELEAELLARLMVRLGSKEDVARTAVAGAAVAAAPAAGARNAARTTPAALPATATLSLNEPFDRAWRQVGLALDRSGFTVEDRDRSAGLYFVRYMDPRLIGKEEPNFLQRLFGGDKESRPVRYRVALKGTGNTTAVAVQNSQGDADNSEAARQIVGRIAEELKP